MDAEIPKLGSGAEPADCPVWRTAYQLSIRKKQEWCRSNASHFRSLSTPSAFVLRPFQVGPVDKLTFSVFISACFLEMP